MKRIFTLLSIVSVSVAVLFTSCSKSKDASPTHVEESDKTLTVTLKTPPSEGSNVWLFSIADGVVETGDMIGAYNDSVLKIAPPAEAAKYDLVVFIADDKSWVPTEGLPETGWGDGYYAVFNVDDNPKAGFVADAFVMLEAYKVDEEKEDSPLTVNLADAGTLRSVITSGGIEGLATSYNEGDIVSISVSPGDSEGGYIKEVQFYIDGQKIATQVAKPYYIDWNTKNEAPGDYEVEVVIVNNTGIEYSLKDEFKINYPSTGTAPDIQFGAISTATVTVETTVYVYVTNSDDVVSGSVTADGTPLSGGKSETDDDRYEFKWTPYGTPGDIVTLKATFVDASGNERIIYQNVKLEKAPESL